MSKGAGEKVLRLPSVLGVFSPRSCLTLHPGESLQPIALFGEGEGGRGTPFALLFQLDSHTPRRHSKLRRQSPQREGWPRAPPAVPALRESVREALMGR